MKKGSKLVKNEDMNYYRVAEVAALWGVPERTVRDYCAKGKINDVVLKGKTWLIPKDAKKPEINIQRIKKSLLKRIKEEKSVKLSGGIYHRIQIDLTYNSNHIEGSTLTHDETRYIFETNTVGIKNKSLNIDDIVETTNHFRCIDLIIDKANSELNESLIKKLHFTLKNGTSDSRKSWFAVGDYKKLENEVGGNITTKPKDVSKEIKKLLVKYNGLKKVTIEDIIDFHYQFEKIHPFQDGNGRIGRLIMFKECLKNGLVPFIIQDKMKMYYYRGLKEWPKTKGYLKDTCLSAQDNFKFILDRFNIQYDK